MLNTIVMYIGIAGTAALAIYVVVAPILEARTRRANMRAWKRMTVAAAVILRERREAYRAAIERGDDDHCICGEPRPCPHVDPETE